MGLFDTLSSYLTFSDPTVVDAEAADPPKDEGADTKDEDVKEDAKDEEGGEEDAAEEEPAAAEEEEEEEEPEDPKAKLEEGK
jgi:ubiquinol-cytochrome c reductase subunit 6